MKKRIAVMPIFEYRGKKRLFLVTSRISGHWIIPTGKYEELLTPKQVAVLEAFEEAGVGGNIDKKFCKTISMKLQRGGPKRKLKIFRMNVEKVHTKWPEKNQRKRALVPINKLSDWVKDKSYAKQLLQFAQS